MHYPNYLLAGVAVVVSGVVTKLGHQVGRARELGSYRLGELLGRGGMGEVYLATHRMLARPAAIKLIRPEALAGEDGTKAQLATARFRREAEAAARLKSPHTVQLYDFGVTDEGRLYLVMELLEGLDSTAWCAATGRCPRRGWFTSCARCASRRGGPRRGAGPPGHQARQHPSGAGRPGTGLRQGARFRAGQIGRGGRRR